MTEDIQKWEARQPEKEAVSVGPNAVVLMAMQKGYDPALIEKMMDLQDRHDKNEARKAYHEAMATFKANPPEIEKDRAVSYETQKGTTSYKHATLANVTQKINRALSVCGLSAAWGTRQDNGTITVTCTVTHKLGHSENTSLTAQPDTSGSKNSIQAIGSTISYLERYTILALTGLATHEMDDDGIGGGPEDFVSPEQVKEMTSLITAKNVYLPKFLSYMNSETVDTILAKDIKKAMGVLNKAKATQKPERQPGEEG